MGPHLGVEAGNRRQRADASYQYAGGGAVHFDETDPSSFSPAGNNKQPYVYSGGESRKRTLNKAYEIICISLCEISI